MGKKALLINSDGTFAVVKPDQLGLMGTLARGDLPDPANSLRALVDKDLREQVVAANQNSPELLNSNLDGRGHPYYVDATTGFSPQEQADLVNSLLSLDDNPGEF